MKQQTAKYILLSFFMYFYIFISLWIYVEICKFNDLYSYFFIYLTMYILDYYLTLKWIFIKKHNKSIFIKYLIYLFTFLLINTYIYEIISDSFFYMYAAFIVAVLIFPLRYLVSKKWVYK